MLACHPWGVEMTSPTTAAAAPAAPAATAHASAAVTAAAAWSHSPRKAVGLGLCSAAKAVLDIRGSHCHEHQPLPASGPWALGTRKTGSAWALQTKSWKLVMLMVTGTLLTLPERPWQ